MGKLFKVLAAWFVSIAVAWAWIDVMVPYTFDLIETIIDCISKKDKR